MIVTDVRANLDRAEIAAAHVRRVLAVHHMRADIQADVEALLVIALAVVKFTAENQG